MPVALILGLWMVATPLATPTVPDAALRDPDLVTAGGAESVNNRPHDLTVVPA